MKHKKLAVHLLFFLFVFAITYYLKPVTLILAQDDFSSSQDVTSEATSNDAPTDQSVSEPQQDFGSQSPSEIDSVATGSWDSDPNFSPDYGSQSPSEIDGVATGDWVTGSDISGLGEGVTQAQEAESKAYNDLYSWENNPPSGISPEEWTSTHEQLQQAAAESSAATQIAQGTFDAGNASAVSDTTALGAAQDQMHTDLASLSSGQLDLEQVQSQIDLASRNIPESFNAGERAAVWGGSGLDPASAGELAQADAISREEGVGTQMGAYQIAYSAAGGTDITGDQVTYDAIAAVASSLDINDPKQSLTFAEAAFATANTHNANPADVASQLKELGISQSTIEAAAENKGVGDKISAPVAANPDAAAAGPTNATSAPTTSAPAGAPQPAPAPAPQPAPPAPEPEPVTPPATTGQSSGSGLEPGYSATTTTKDSSEGKFSTYSSTTSFTGPEGYVGTVSVTTTYDPGIPGDSKFPPTSTTVVTSNVNGRDPNEQTAISGIEVPKDGALTTSQAIEAAKQAGISVPGTK